MLRFVHALVFALVASLGIASGAHALGSKTALRANFESASDRVGALALEALGTRQQNASHGTAVTSECSYAARGAGQAAKYVATTQKSAIALSKQLASEAQLGEMIAGTGSRIAGAGARAVFRDAGRIAQTYGGNAADWVKMSSSGFRAADGTTFATHWVENIVTGMKVEPKVVIDVFGGL